MTPTPLSLKAMREVADKANEGEWRVGYEDGSGVGPDGYCITANGNPIVFSCVSFGLPVGIQDQDVAAHVATFQPVTVKRLLDIAAKARELAEHNTEMFDAECPACTEFLKSLEGLTE